MSFLKKYKKQFDDVKSQVTGDKASHGVCPAFRVSGFDAPLTNGQDLVADMRPVVNMVDMASNRKVATVKHLKVDMDSLRKQVMANHRMMDKADTAKHLQAAMDSLNQRMGSHQLVPTAKPQPVAAPELEVTIPCPRSHLAGTRNGIRTATAGIS